MRMEWEARAAKLNISRAYSLSVTRDLFGWIMVEQRWGRIGGSGQGRVLAFNEAGAARRHIRGIVRRRATAEQRIGVPYERIR